MPFITKMHDFLFLQGIDKYVVEDTEVARSNKNSYPRPLHVIEGPLMNGKDTFFILN